MAGVIINGFGWSDSYYPRLNLGQHYCKFCNSMQNFALMEVKAKIRIFFVPTVSFSTKYCVCCEKCQNGIYVNDEQRDLLLYRGAKIEVRDGISIVTKSD